MNESNETADLNIYLNHHFLPVIGFNCSVAIIRFLSFERNFDKLNNAIKAEVILPFIHSKELSSDLSLRVPT